MIKDNEFIANSDNNSASLMNLQASILDLYLFYKKMIQKTFSAANNRRSYFKRPRPVTLKIAVRPRRMPQNRAASAISYINTMMKKILWM